MATTHCVMAECDACGATGLYSGMCEGPGVAVVCLECKGTGAKPIHYTPFVQRKPKRGIKTVRNSAGRFIATGVGPRGKAISYERFAAGEFPRD